MNIALLSGKDTIIFYVCKWCNLRYASNTAQTQEYVINTKEGRKTRQNHCNHIQTGLSTLRFENEHKERHGEAVKCIRMESKQEQKAGD